MVFLGYNFYMVQIISPDLIPTGRQTPVSQALEQAVIKIVSALSPEKEEIAQALHDRDYFIQEIISNEIILYERNK
jgi:hypothetical protein